MTPYTSWEDEGSWRDLRRDDIQVMLVSGYEFNQDHASVSDASKFEVKAKGYERATVTGNRVEKDGARRVWHLDPVQIVADADLNATGAVFFFGRELLGYEPVKADQWGVRMVWPEGALRR